MPGSSLVAILPGWSPGAESACTLPTHCADRIPVICAGEKENRVRRAIRAVVPRGYVG